MGRKKIDNRIKVLVENSVKTRQRTLFVVVGAKAREQVPNLHYMLTKARVKARPNVLWCYNKELGFASDDKSRYKRLKELAAKQEKKQDQRVKELKKAVKDGALDRAEADKLVAEQLDEATLEQQLLENPFNVFLAATQIRFCYFRETQAILGQTFSMLVLQDFEGVTPNVLARTVETVEGGGMTILLLPNLTSLKQLYTMAMDVHSRFRSEADEELNIAGRFNERFLLSLSNNQQCLVVDDELNVLPLSSHIRDIKPITIDEEARMGDVVADESMRQLVSLKDSLADTPLVGPLVKLSRTLDQAKALMQFVEAISSNKATSAGIIGHADAASASSNLATVALTAARGRGKSASLGLAMAAAVAYGYSNIFVTAPSPENLKTLFEFVFQGFDALGYKDQEDYEIVQASSEKFLKAVIRVNVFKETHRQTIQYIEPADAAKLGQCELLIIDEAAAIPLPIVKELLGPYTTFISSTVNGYEGTGRSLSLKLLEQLKAKSQGGRGPRFYEIKLEEPIRYGKGDGVERWLNELLCLDATSAVQIASKCPHPSECQLYYVNRDTLFSYHEASERFLHNMMSLYVSSHYKNTPNDLQVMADAPQHHLFVLLGPIDENTTSLPDIYCVVQLAMEGRINKRIVQAHLSRGESPSGDLIPYLVSRQFQEPEFGGLSGARVVRIATHPEYQRMGYGGRSLDLLSKYFEGELYSLDEDDDDDDNEDGDEDDGAEDDGDANEPAAGRAKGSAQQQQSLLTEEIKPRDRSKLPPLLQSLTEREPEKLQYLGVSYGMTQHLYNFWKKHTFRPVYVRLTENEVTGEHTCVMLRALRNARDAQDKQTKLLQALLPQFCSDFQKRLLSLLGFEFRKFSPQLVLSLLDFKSMDSASAGVGLESLRLTVAEMDMLFSKFDLKRLQAYSKNLLDYHVVLDLLPVLARVFFQQKVPIGVSYTQAAILASVGLQHKNLDTVYKELGLQTNQALALFNKTIRKFVAFLRDLENERFAPGATRSTVAVAEATAKATDDILEDIALDQDEEEEDADEMAAAAGSSAEDGDGGLMLDDDNDRDDNGDGDDVDESDDDGDAQDSHGLSKEMLNIFEAPLDEEEEMELADQEDVKRSKKRKRTGGGDDDQDEQEDEEARTMKRAREQLAEKRKHQGKKRSKLAEEILKEKEKYDLVGITGEQLRGAELDEESGTVYVKKDGSAASADKHKLRGKKFMKQKQQELKHKKTKGAHGTKQRKVKE